MNIIEYENYHERENTADNHFPYLTYPCSIPLDFAEVPLHWHYEMEIIYIKKGTGIVSVNQQDYIVCPGDLIFVCPGQLHAIRQWRQESMEYENIIFDLRLLGSLQTDLTLQKFILPLMLRKCIIQTHLTADAFPYSQISSCIDQIDEIRRTFPDGYELFIHGKLMELFFLFYHLEMVSVSANVSPTRQKTLEKMRKILKYIEEHYNEPLSIAMMANASGFSESHFMKFFKQVFGTSFTSYLNTYRLTMAARMLLSSEDSILEIAVESGFENLSYFNRMFKRKYHMTPKQYRRHHTTDFQDKETVS